MTILVHARYGLNSRGAALIFIGAVVPSFGSSPLAGHFADKCGARWPVVVCLVLGTPFFGLISMEGSLSTFIIWIALTGASSSPLSSTPLYANTNPPFLFLLGLFIMGIAAPIMQGLSPFASNTCFPGRSRC